MHSKLVVAGVVLLALAAGVVWLGGGAPIDFAIAVMPGWHVTLFPPPPVVPLLLALAGAGLLGLALMTKSAS